MRTDYHYVENPNPHPQRSREIIKKYPQVKELMNPYPWTFGYISLINITQVTLAILLRNQPWYLIVLVAYLFGSLCNHALFVLIHDAGHNAIFRTQWANILSGIWANVAQAVPTAQSFRIYHMIHHSNMCEYDYDADLAFHWEAKWVGNIWWRKALWFLLFGVIEAIRPLRLKRKPFDKWIVINFVLIVAFDALLVWAFGPWALIYLLLSTAFSVGLHPVGARWIQEHYTYKEGQNTFSYYGPMNIIQFNIGFHNEHHDFYRVPWINLPKLKKIAPEFYDKLFAHTSWTALMLDFIFNKDRDLYMRRVKEVKPASEEKELSPNLGPTVEPLSSSELAL